MKFPYSYNVSRVLLTLNEPSLIVDHRRDLSMRPNQTNVVNFFLQQACDFPNRLALVFPLEWNSQEVTKDIQVTFEELLKLVTDYSLGLKEEGFKEGDRAVFLMPLCIDLYALILAALANGLVPVFLDSTMPARRMLQAIKDSKAHLVISTSALMKLRFFLPALWSCKLYSSDSEGVFLKPLRQLKKRATGSLAPVPRKPSDEALITYTTGSMGRPKGADRNQEILTAQHLISQALWPHRENEVDMPCFPMIALQNLACGIPTIIPALSFKNLALFDASPVIWQIKKYGVTRLSGAPAYFKILVEHLESCGQKMSEIRGIVVGGAPVPWWLCEKILKVFPESDSYVVYGSTEAEPMAYVSMREIIDAASGSSVSLERCGYLVGRPVSDVNLEVLRLPEDLSLFTERGPEAFRVPDYENGEVLVSGAHVVKRYFNDETANCITKLRGPDGRVWHRTEDLGYRDDLGRLWLTGRRNDQITIGDWPFPNYSLELFFDALPSVSRSAFIVNARDQSPRLYVEKQPSSTCDEALTEVHSVLESLKLKGIRCEVINQLPVDQRHHWKIDRAQLRVL